MSPSPPSLSSVSSYSNPKSWKIESHIKTEHLTVVSVSTIMNTASEVLISMPHLNIRWHAIFMHGQVDWDLISEGTNLLTPSVPNSA